MKFLIGGKAREPYGRIRLDSGADSIVWMEEDREIEISVFFLLGISTPKQLCFGDFFIKKRFTLALINECSNNIEMLQDFNISSSFSSPLNAVFRALISDIQM